MATLLQSATFLSRKADGTPNALGLVYTYAAGGLTPQATYTTQAGDVEQTNPVVLGADGTAQIWLDSALSYRFIEKTAADVTIRDTDNYSTGTSIADIASTAVNKGDSLVGVKLTATGAASRTQHDKNEESVSLSDFAGATDTDKLAAALAHCGTSGAALFIDRDITATSRCDLPDADIEVFGHGVTITTPTASSVFRRMHRARFFRMHGLDFAGDGVAFHYDGAAIGDMTGGATPSAPYGTQHYEYEIFGCRFFQGAGADAIYLHGSREGHIHDCYFEGNKGIRTKFTINTTISNCDFKNCVYGIDSETGSEGLKVSGGTALGCAMVLRATRTNSVQITGVMWDYNDACVGLYGVYEGSIMSSYFSTRTSTPAIFTTDTGGYRTQHIAIVGNASIRTNYNNAAADCIRLENSDFITIEGNNILNWQDIGIQHAGCAELRILGNVISPKSGAGNYSIAYDSSEAATTYIEGNYLGKPILRTTTRNIRRNSGYVTENSGEFTIPSGSGASGYAVAHGLALTPEKKNIKFDPTSTILTATRWWIDAVDATNITFKTDANVSADASFSWQAVISL